MAVQPLIGQYVTPNLLGPYYISGAPVAGTNEVQTLNINATGGTFTLAYEGTRSAPIPWNATNATLLAAIQAQLDAMFGTNWVVATAGTLTAGVGTILLTFSGGNFAKNTVSLMTVANNSLTGTATATITQTTPGVKATGLGSATGAQFIRTDNGLLYQNTGTPSSPTLTVQA